MKRYLAFFALIAILAMLLCGCGASTERLYTKDMAATTEAVMPAEAPMMAGGAVMNYAKSEFSSSDAGVQSFVADNKDLAAKIIYSADLSIETLTFDETAAALTKAVSEFGGFTQHSGVYGNTNYDSSGAVSMNDRSANYTFRIPAEKLDAFLQQVGTTGNVVSKNLSATNVTSQYTDYEARLDSLKTEQTRLLELLEKADTVDTLLAIESKLTDVRYEIDSVTRNLRNLDNDIAYSDVNIYLREVRVYTPNHAVQRSLWQRIGDAFVDGWNGFVRGIGDAIVFLSGSFFGILLLAIVCFVIVRIVLAKKKKAKAAAEQVSAPAPSDDEPKP